MFSVMCCHSALYNFDVGVTSTTLTATHSPTRLSTAEYHTCGVFLDWFKKYSRVRIPCESARGRYVFVRKRDNEFPPLVLYEMEVYVQRKCDDFYTQRGPAFDTYHH